MKGYKNIWLDLRTRHSFAMENEITNSNIAVGEITEVFCNQDSSAGYLRAE